VVNPDRKKLKDNADRLPKTWIAKCHGRDGTGQGQRDLRHKPG